MLTQADTRSNLRGLDVGVIFVSFFGLYVHYLFPGLAPRDGIEVATRVPQLLPLHQPGYPLYVVVAKAFGLAVPFGGFAYRLNLFSAFCSALCLSFTYLATRDSLAKHTRSDVIAVLASLIGTFSIGFCPLFLQQALAAEVFALNSLFFALILWMCACFLNYGEDRAILAAGFILGLALTHHQTIVFIIPAILVLICFGKTPPKKVIISVEVLLIAGFSAYLILIPLSRQSFFAAQSWRDLLSNLLRRRFGTLSLAREGVFAQASQFSMGTWMEWLLQEIYSGLGPVGCVLMIIGLASAFIRRRNQSLVVGSLMAFILAGPVFLLLIARMAPTAENFETVSRFMQLPSVALIPILGTGVFELISLAPEIKRRAAYLVVMLLAFSIWLWGAKSLYSMGRRDCFITQDLAENLWRSTAPNSTMLLEDESLDFEYEKLRSEAHASVPMHAIVYNVSPEQRRALWGQMVRQLLPRSPVLISSTLAFTLGLPKLTGSISDNGLFVRLDQAASGTRREEPGVDDLYVLRGTDDVNFLNDAFLSKLVAKYAMAAGVEKNVAIMKGDRLKAYNKCRAIFRFAQTEEGHRLSQDCLSSLGLKASR